MRSLLFFSVALASLGSCLPKGSPLHQDSLLTRQTSTQSSYPLPSPCTGPACMNPSSDLDYQDFSVIQRRSDGVFFRFAKSNATGQGLSVATSPGLSGPWTFSYTALSGSLLSPVASDRTQTNVWAPDVKYVDSTYYLFYSVNAAPFSFDLCVATSTTLEDGSWTDHGSMNVAAAAGDTYVRLDGNMIASSIDPSGVLLDDASRVMTFGSYQWGLYSFTVSNDLLTIQSGAPVQEVVADQTNPAPYSGNKTEGPFQLQNDGYVYLFYSIGNCCAALDTSYEDSVYRVQVCRRPVGSAISGAYVDRDGQNCVTGGTGRAGTTILASSSDGQVFAPGSVGVINVPAEGGLVMYYQYQNATSAAQSAGLNGLTFGWNKLAWDSDGWPYLV